ncbi:MAG: hypothetical protein ACI9A7_000123 [Cyclobacteriaceae bacterium]|jgi:hypothetical protein
MRMLLQTGLIIKLVDQGLTIALIVPDEKDENLLALSYSDKIKLIEWKSRSTIWDDDYLHKRMYFLEDIKRNKALMEKFYNGLFYSDSKHPWKRIRPLYYYTIYKLIKFFPSIRQHFLNRESEHLYSSEANAILSEINPKLLVSTYPVSIIEAKMLAAAKTANIPTLLHLLSWDNITAKGKFPVLPDNFIVWGEIMKMELQEYYQIKEKEISICGVPHFDEHIEVSNNGNCHLLVKDLGLDAELPYLFFAMSSPRFAPREIDIVEWLAAAVRNNVFGQKMQLIVRPHPQNVKEFTSKKSWLQRLNTLSGQRIAIDYPQLNESKIRWSMKKEDMQNLAKLISGCVLCLNSGSTVSIDALMHGKPVVITAFDGDSKLSYWNSARRLIDYTHLAKYIAAGGADVANSYDSLTHIIQAYIDDPQLNNAKRRQALLSECYRDDGKSTERVVSSLIAVLKSSVT